jgi:hypothetical protein
MPRPANANPPREVHVNLPADLAERLDRFLWSDLLGKVPYGARSDLFVSLLTNYLNIVEGEENESV